MKTWKNGTFAAFLTIFGIISIFTACDNGNNDPTYDNIIISPDTAYIAQGRTQTFTAIIKANNNPNQNVTWSVAGGKAGTTINDGVLAVANDETDNTILTIKATSSVVSSLFATKTVTIHKGVDFFGTWINGTKTTTFIFSTNKLDINDNGIFAKINNPVWKAEDNTKASQSIYPSGFNLSGIFSADSGYGAGTSFNLSVYINDQKNKINAFSGGSTDEGIFIKQ